MTERDAYALCSLIPGLGPMRFSALLSYFGNAAPIFQATQRSLQSIHLPVSVISQIRTMRSFDLSKWYANLAKEHISCIPRFNPNYPKRLRAIPDAPIVVFTKSSSGVHVDLERAIGVVGTRRVTPYGKVVTERIVRGLVREGIPIISGMAYGVDAIAHRTAIQNSGKTVAVLGCGVDEIAPRGNADIYHALCEGGYGAVVSEMAPGVHPDKRLFPTRNRIISGLSLGIVVVEGLETSGSLITARYALEQGREVFAVPGPITSMYSKGPLKLIKEGATPIESADDVLSALQLKKKDLQQIIKKSALTNEEERRIIACLSSTVMGCDDIIACSNLPAPVVFSTLTVLEMKGIIKDIGEKHYEINTS